MLCWLVSSNAKPQQLVACSALPSVGDVKTEEFRYVPVLFQKLNNLKFSLYWPYQKVTAYLFLINRGFHPEFSVGARKPEKLLSWSILGIKPVEQLMWFEIDEAQRTPRAAVSTDFLNGF